MSESMRLGVSLPGETSDSKIFRPHVLAPDEWSLLRDLRLLALKDSPDSFLSNYEREDRYEDAQWKAEFERGEWMVAFDQDAPVGVLGAVSGWDKPDIDRYLEYLWVSPMSRRYGVASLLIRAFLARLTDQGIATVWLWILNGNDPAWRLYTKLGFVTTNEKQELRDRVGRYEERMSLDLRSLPGGPLSSAVLAGDE